MLQDLKNEIEIVGKIEVVPAILEVVCRTTGMGFAAVARVTEQHWIACSVLDEIDFGLKPGGELKLETTICHEIRQSGQPVVIEHVAEEPEWCQHATPQMYGFQSYISMPIILGDGSFFGTLCAIDPRPARLKAPAIVNMFRLFADLIGKHIDNGQRLLASESKLLEERETAQLREQFIAVLGHDLRTPIRAITSFTDLLLRTPLTPQGAEAARVIRSSASRMSGLISNVLDLARGRLGGGLPLHLSSDQSLEPVLQEVIGELSSGAPARLIETSFRLDGPVRCDPGRIAQLFSNLLSNAFTYGAEDQPIRVKASTGERRFTLCVANAGEPIPPAAMERLFQPFYRSAALVHQEGLGLGLYIAKEIAVAHGGTLEVESTTQETCFTFSMPQGC